MSEFQNGSRGLRQFKTILERFKALVERSNPF